VTAASSRSGRSIRPSSPPASSRTRSCAPSTATACASSSSTASTATSTRCPRSGS
jgi:hypothetical protein